MKKFAYFFISAGFAMLLMTACSKKESISTSGKVYIERLGIDTLSAESLGSANEGYSGKLLQRMPVTQVASFHVTLNKKGTVSDMSINWKTPTDNPNGPKPRSYEISIDGTRAIIKKKGDWRGKQIDTTYSMTVPNGVVPDFGKYPPALYTFQQVIRQSNLKAGGSVYNTKLISPKSKRLTSVQLRYISKDTLAMKATFGYTYLAKINKQKQIVWYSAKHSTVHTITKPATSASINKMADLFARKDAEGKGMKIASPPGTAVATLDGAHLKIDYNRPFVRGRKIWGGLVPWNKVWRTGADPATEFTTSKNLIIGNTKVPAGHYTIYSIYTPNSAKLIINSQTGQWGTVYHKSRDFARIPMQKKQIKRVKEFTISFAKEMGKWYLQLSWDRTRYQVPIKVE